MVACSGGPTDMAASRARVLFGLVVMVVGALLLADRFDWWGLQAHLPLWPWILILLGIAKLSGARRHPISRVGWWLIAIGIWGIVTEFQVLGFGFRRAWPLLIVIVGAFLIWRAIDPPAHDTRGGRS
jgi:xanthine/uracil permease